MVVLARCFSKLGSLITKLEQQGIGENTTPFLRKMWDAHKLDLRRELAMVLDLEVLVKATYILEGDGLVGLLLANKVDEIRALGRKMVTDSSVMPNLAAVLRAEEEIKVGTEVHEYFAAPFDAWYKGKVVRVSADLTTFTIKYEDNTHCTGDEAEVRRWVVVVGKPMYTKYIGYGHGGFHLH